MPLFAPSSPIRPSPQMPDRRAGLSHALLRDQAEQALQMLRAQIRPPGMPGGMPGGMTPGGAPISPGPSPMAMGGGGMPGGMSPGGALPMGGGHAAPGGMSISQLLSSPQFRALPPQVQAGVHRLVLGKQMGGMPTGGGAMPRPPFGGRGPGLSTMLAGPGR